MKTTLVSLSIALALGTLAACDRNPNTPKQSGATPSSSSTPSPSAPTAGTGSSTPQSNTDHTPANLGKPSDAESKPSSQPPVQGREDVREPAQRRDFKQPGDSAGPKGG